MFCPSCGKGVDEIDGFCRFCGRSLSADKPSSMELVPESSATGPVGGHEQPVRRSGEATASLVLGLLSVIPVMGLFAAIFGHMAKASIRRSAGRLLGEGMAETGLALGYLSLIGWTLYAIVTFVVPAFPSRIKSNERFAMSSLRVMNAAEMTYATIYQDGYSSALADLGPPKTGNSNLSTNEYIKLLGSRTAGLLAEFEVSGTFDGYHYTYVASKRDKDGKIESYTVHADPITPGETGRKHFFTDQSEVIREEMDKPANENSPPIGFSH